MPFLSKMMERVLEVKFRNDSSRLALFSMMVPVTTEANLIAVSMQPLLAEYDLSPIRIYSLGILISGAVTDLAQGIGTFYKTIGVFG